MYLKRIEIQGFKSFANKMLFEFDEGITGIVGPNGSGKSNIADAVRWVLGEQSAKILRSSRMEDIIFSGTQARKPQSFASVSLVMDNADRAIDIDYNEITVTRRVFRSGESEYILNGNACRLKDINELFYDTGIGQEGYSIIGQGQVEKIISGRADERRELFDEAAGIVKFKKRKTAAQRNLDAESNNLVRINDILGELEKQVGPLEKQSEKAKAYLQYKEDLKKYEVNLFLLDSEEIKGKLAEQTGRLEIVNNDLAEASSKYEEIKNVYDEKQEALASVDARIDELGALNNQALIDRNKLESQIAILNEQINTEAINDKHFTERIASIKEQIEEREEEKQNLIAEKDAISAGADDIYGRKNESDRAIESLNNRINALTKEIEDRRNTFYTNLNNKNEITASEQRYRAMLEQLNIRKAELTSKLLSYKSDEDTYEASLGRFKAELDEVVGQIDALNETIAFTAANQQDLKDEKEKLKKGINEAKEERIRLSSHLETLRNIAERYDGYGNSIKRVMENKNRESGIIGVVADIIRSEKQYEVAIETALGGTIQNIVTKDEETAKRMIRFLKENKAGRATFLPLDALKYKGLSSLPDGEKGYIGLASDLVDVDSEYKELARYLLGRCLVVDTVDNAVMINRKNNYSYRIVTLEGELLAPGGSMSGGAYKNSSNLLGRRREIEELEGKISEKNTYIDEVNKRLDELSLQIAANDESLEDNKAKLQELAIVKNTKQLSYDQMKEKTDEIKLVYTDNVRETREMEDQVKEINSNLEGLTSRTLEIDTTNNDITRANEEASSTLEELKSELEKRNADAVGINEEFVNIKSSLEFKEEGLKRVLREIARLKDDIDDLEDNRSDSKEQITVKNEQIESIKETIKVACDTIEEYERELAELKEKKNALNEENKSFFASIEEYREKVSLLDKEQFRLNDSITKLENDRDSHIDYMWNEYELTISEAQALRNEELGDMPEMKKMIAGIKGDIKRLGDVNVNSIEEYKEVSERYEFLKKQHDDLIEATDKLKGVIAELDTGMRERFTEQFELIKVEFDKVFKQLFGGGHGELKLQDDMDILDADIAIIAQPPGKAVKNMMQLSGGEKSLTAICILFAIQNLKPSPFCLLDEIEAALDDSNIDNFAKYLHKLTRHTQFICITHRRGTMNAADRLYGITMQEKGVSTLVSVDLVEKELDDKPAEVK